MASINSIGLENYSEMETHRGVAYTGTLLLNGERIGDFTNHGDGGATVIHVDPNVREDFHQRIRKYYEQHPATMHDDDDFINELISLHQAEEVFREQTAPGAILLETYQYTRETPLDEMEFDKLGPSYFQIHFEEHLNKVLEKEKPVQYHVYRSLDDFNW